MTITVLIGFERATPGMAGAMVQTMTRKTWTKMPVGKDWLELNTLLGSDGKGFDTERTA